MAKTTNDPPVPTAAELLAQVPYFREQEAAAIQALAEAAQPVRCAAGEILFLQDEPVAGLFLIAAGRVKICRLSPEGKMHILHLAGVGETFNEVAVLDGGPNPATAIAHSEAVLWRISRDQLQRLAERYPSVAWAMAETIASRTRQLVGLVEDLAMRTVKGRLARLLLEQAQAQETDTVPRYLTQEEMAQQLGTVREMVSRVLRSLAAEGIIQFDRHRILILDARRLAEEAEA